MSEKMKCGKVNVRLRLFTFATLRIAIFLYKLSMTSSKRIEESETLKPFFLRLSFRFFTASTPML